MGQQGSPLSPEIRRVVVSLKHYFDRIQDDPQEQKLPSVTRVSRALEIGVATVRRIMADYNRDPQLLEKAPLARGRPKLRINETTQTVVRDYVRQSNAQGRYLTLEMLHDYLETELGDQAYSIRTLGRALDRWGFTFDKGVRSAHLKEKDYVVVARRRYLRAKLANRKRDKTHRPEVYLDEAYVNKNHSNNYIWYFGEEGPRIQKPTGKGEWLIIINAITEAGWVPGAKLVFKGTEKTGDYHDQMNYELFAKWFEERLLANLLEPSLIILDNASYHNVLSEHSAPTGSYTKECIRYWLEKNNIPLPEDYLRAEMVELLNKIAPVPTYAIDEMAEKHGHQVLRTPPYHPELQPIETFWAVVKNTVACKCDFTIANLVVQIEQAFEEVTKKTCVDLIKKIRKVEDAFWEEDSILY